MTDALPRGLYFAADTDLLDPAQTREVTRAALEGGVVLVQLRAKNMAPPAIVQLAGELVSICDEFDVPLLVNDLPQVARDAGAAGVHLGQDDVPVMKARSLLGQAAIIGATTPTPEAVRRAEAEGADYVSAGPMFRSRTKPAKPVAGPELARTLSLITKVPLCVIGGIDATNVHELADCGVDLVCVISAIAQSSDPRRDTKRLIAAMEAAGVAVA